ncbi:hypothetical protein G6F57_003198 [Rhizopus arrhizus]|nr:hypothetical protein G6F30_003713 [Rhizopus arrhizus]KAG1428181.1 hypothetical protein G6F58_000694 [Rhizopus delemar]KAG0986402.1 hypothetical protein G6F29_003288 [Rhizopus arrhizus]KAG0996242.1 hypothetical protein G6F28_004031 [Rhizopus arrhizus]KAG1013751.1 hypothetical protein G6F27_001597 [Rhizopus arrhizus]
MPSPYSTSSSPGYHSPNVHRNATSIPLKKYTLQPPPRKLPLSKTMSSLGYPDMFPQRPGQDEDVLSESNIRQGFIDRPIVSNENSSAHDIVFGKLQEDQRALSDLSDFIIDVLHRQNRASYITGPSSFRPPVRTTLIDAKREQWMHELSSGVVPLRKLAKNVPHGFKGEKLLETLATKQVPFLRATWYIKIVGLSEMNQRNASNAAPPAGHQSVQWTTIVTSHLKKQLNELVLSPHTSNSNSNNAASPHAAGTPNRGYRNYSNHHENSAKPWLTPESRARFEQRWSYSVQLARWQYYEGLIDQKTFLRWSIDTLAASTSFEIMWVILTGLIQDYVDEYKRNRTLTKLLIETLIRYYSALQQYINHNTLEETDQRVHQGLQKDIEIVLQSLFLSTPDMFVIPKLYQQYHHLLNVIIGEEVTSRSTKTSSDMRRVMNEYWSMIKARNETFCGKMKKSPVGQKTSQSTHESGSGDEERIVTLLDSIGKNIDSVSGLQINGETWTDAHGHSAKWASKTIFGTARLESDRIIKLIHLICRWAVSESRYGDWKAYLVASILSSWKEENSSPENKTLLQEALIQFLDGEVDPESMSCDEDEDFRIEGEENHIKRPNVHIVYLYDVLIRSSLFSYQKFLLRLIARGDLEPRRRNEHIIQQRLHYLASFPLLTPAPAYLINQRRVALYGTRNGSNNKEVETEALNDLKHLARLAVMGFDHHNTDCLFGINAQDMTQPILADTFESYNLAFSQELKHKLMSTMDSMTRYSVLEFTSHWLLNEVKKFVVKSIQIGEDNWRVMTSPGSCLLNTRQLVTIIQIMECAKDYLSIIEMTLWVLQKSNDTSLHPYIIDTFRKYSCYWKLTNNSARVIQAVWTKHVNLCSRGEKDRNIMMYMVQLVQEGYQMDDLSRSQLQQELQIKSKTRSHYTNNLSVKSELMQLTKDFHVSSIQMVAESLSLPSQNAAGWIGIILENAGDVLRMIGKEKGIDKEIKSYRHGRFLSQALFEFHRLLRTLALIIKQVVNATILTGQADNAVIYWLWNNEVVQEDMYQENSWVPLFVITLVANNVIALDTLIKSFAIPWFERIGQEGQQQFCSEDTKLNVFCQNLIVLIRLLVIQNDNEPKSEEASLSWPLRIEEFFQLEVQRQMNLASSLDRIDPLFGLMERMILIATNLPLSSSLLQDLVMLRADLLQIPWFRQACLRDLNGVYQRFASREAEAVTEKRLKKKMLSIVEELIGGDLVASQSIIQDTAPNFIDKLHKVFLNVSQWNEAQCRVQMNLLLDNISLYDVNSQNPNNPHILGDDLSMDITSDIGVSPPNKDLQSFVSFFYDVVLADGHFERAATQRRFQFFKNLIHELRKPVLSELLAHAVRLLEGDPAQAFPDSVLLMPPSEQHAPFDSNTFAYRSQAFLNMTQHMLAENVWPIEKKVDLVKTVFQQILRFRNSLSVYKVMQSVNISFAEASAALQATKNNTDMAITMLLTEGSLESTLVEMDHERKLSLQDIRTSLLLRLRLIVPYISLIWEHPNEKECDILGWIRTLVQLLGSPLVHGNGSQERFFEFILDFVSILIDELPRKLKRESLHILNAMQHELSSVPEMFQGRVKRIMPFTAHNIYLNSTHLASSLLGLQPSNDVQQQQEHLQACLEQSKPWEWLEDYVNETPHDNDAPISLTIFNALKPKSVDSTYIKWFKYGFDTGNTSQPTS